MPFASETGLNLPIVLENTSKFAFRFRNRSKVGAARQPQHAARHLKGSGWRVEVEGLGFRVDGLGCRVDGSGFRVEGEGLGLVDCCITQL